MTKEIKLTQGQVALVDDDMFDLLNTHKWFAVKPGKTFYAARHVGGRKNTRTIFMHQVVLPTEPGFSPDHVNRNGLDNRRENLRPATPLQQVGNCGKRSHSLSRFKGIKRTGNKSKPWKAQISRGGKKYHLGAFLTDEEAARAYDVAARDYFGEFANCNFTEEQ